LSKARTYSARLGAITVEQFQAALDRFDLGQFLGAEPIRTGNFGQNVYLTSTAGDYVLRGAPFGPDQLPLERYFTNQLHAYTAAPVPWPYRLDPASEIFGWPYVVMPRMPGLHAHDAEERVQLSAADRLGIARAMGATLAELHRLTAPRAGRVDVTTETVRGFEVPFADWVVARIEACVAEGVAPSATAVPADSCWVTDLIARHRWALEIPFTPAFVMQDYKEDNAVVISEAGVWRVSGVFDYQDAYFGDGEADLARPVAVYFEYRPISTLLPARFVPAIASASCSTRSWNGQRSGSLGTATASGGTRRSPYAPGRSPM
jgi:aminoglycoside phosphotransferase (APT) family kinase protein